MSVSPVTEKFELHISVRSLVEFIFRGGDIDNRAGRLQSADVMHEGSRIHRKIQKSMGERYRAEVPLKITEDGELYSLTIEGRADGIFTEEQEDRPETVKADFSVAEDQEARQQNAAAGSSVPERVWIDEIKGMYRGVDSLEEPYFVHKAQAMCYAYIWASQNGLGEIGIQLTYCNLETEEKRLFRQIYSFEALKEWYEDLLARYRRWADFQYEWRRERQASIKKLQFPFSYREGQKRLVEDVYRTILRQKNLFLQASTGVGKTISTIFPAVKAVGEGLGERIFYLTAKTVTATVARETFQLLRENGYHAKIIQITAKEKLCMCGEMECNPVNCPYAQGHYDRVNDAVFELLQEKDVFLREEILAQAEKYRVCPFEMSLDVASFADDIVCDYNYVFDPNVYLKRFFQEGQKSDCIFLVDEAHNLVERSREMYSAAIYKEDFLSARRLVGGLDRKLEKLLQSCNKILLEYKRSCVNYQVSDGIGSLYSALMQLYGRLEEFLQKPQDFAGRSEVLDFYFVLRNFLNIYGLVDEHYVVYSRLQEDGRFMVKLYCVDPSENLQKCIDRGKSAIFFSATLLPVQYYKSLLSTREDNYAVYAESSFSEKQRLLLFGCDVSTKYTRRNEAEFVRIADYIYRTIQCRAGNYMAFFPSYKLMQQVFGQFQKLEEAACASDLLQGRQKCECILQKSGMSEQERENFLQYFAQKHDHPFVAFCVMGGIFGEGIDLKYDQLIGVIVVGTGLPQISDEREILKNYYDARSGNGFDYAFRYPGINKVLQAAGRVIRTSEDQGIILLLDERFLASDYQPLYPRGWETREICTLDTVEEQVRSFWETKVTIG